MRERLKAAEERVYELLEPGREYDDAQLERLILQTILEDRQMQTIDERTLCQKAVFNDIRRLGILQPLMDDPQVTEIMINGKDHIFYEKDGRIYAFNQCFESEERLEALAQRIAGLSNRTVNASSPIVDTRLSDGSRVNICLAPAAVAGPIITIRKFYRTPMTLERLIRMQSISREAAAFLVDAVRAKYNIFISGGTGSGKTTFLNALSKHIPEEERVITIEDSCELQLENVPNLVKLEAHPANMEEKGEVTIRDLIRASLRMRPDRIVVGEVRDAAAIDMITALNTGHDGGLSTGHANSPPDMLLRLETMVMMGLDIPLPAIRQQIASALDLIVHLGRLRDKSRRVLEIDQVSGVVDGKILLVPLFTFREEGEDEQEVKGCLIRTEAPFTDVAKMHAAGIWTY